MAGERGRRRGLFLKEIWAASIRLPLECFGPTISFGKAYRRNGSSSKEPSSSDVEEYAVSVRAPKECESAAWRKFTVLEPLREGAPPEALADFLRAITWKTMGGRTSVKVRLAAKGPQDPDLMGSLAETAGCAGLRLSHLQVTSPGASAKWRPRSVGIRNAPLQADTAQRDVLLRAPLERNPLKRNRARKLKAPAYGKNDAPADFF